MTRPATAVAAVLCASALVSAQPLSRLRGRVMSGVDAPLAGAEVRIEAAYGFRGEDYAGQRHYTVQANNKGEWALIGFKAGGWIFEGWAEGRLPDVIMLPLNLGAAPSSGVAGDMPPWRPVLRPTPVPDTPAGELLKEAADAARAGRTQAMSAALARLSDSGDPRVLVAAGRICLVARDSASARPFFRRALEREPDDFGAALGMASSALMQRQFEVASAEFGEARKLTADKDERSYLTAAIGDLTKLHITWTRTGH